MPGSGTVQAPGTPTVLLFSMDEDRLAVLRRLLALQAPGCTLLETRLVEDAAAQGGSVRVDVAVLDQSGGRPLSPLVRLLRHQSPAVRVLVFTDGPQEAEPRLIPWSKLAERLREALKPRGLTSAGQDPAGQA